jgi:hypothetical protein
LANSELFDRLAGEGFVSLHRLFHGTDQETFFNSKSREHQLDYLYQDLLLYPIRGAL